jgi:hypothetical protein
MRRGLRAYRDHSLCANESWIIIPAGSGQAPPAEGPWTMSERWMIHLLHIGKRSVGLNLPIPFGVDTHSPLTKVHWVPITALSLPGWVRATQGPGLGPLNSWSDHSHLLSMWNGRQENTWEGLLCPALWEHKGRQNRDPTSSSGQSWTPVLRDHRPLAWSKPKGRQV